MLSNNTDNGTLASRRVNMSLKNASNVNEKIHPRSNNMMQDLIERHQLMDTEEYNADICSRDDKGRHKSMTLHLSKLAKV